MTPETAGITAACILALAAGILIRMLIDRARKRAARKKADRRHAALIAEARSEWTLVREFKIECEWTEHGKPVRRAGWVIMFAEHNSLGERRVRVIHKPIGWPVEGMKSFAELKAWEASAQPRSLPRHDLVAA